MGRATVPDLPDDKVSTEGRSPFESDGIPGLEEVLLILSICSPMASWGVLTLNPTRTGHPRPPVSPGTPDARP